MKKTFAVVLAAMMLITAFAGCAKKTDKPATSDTPVTSDVAPAAVSATPAA